MSAECIDLQVSGSSRLTLHKVFAERTHPVSDLMPRKSKKELSTETFLVVPMQAYCHVARWKGKAVSVPVPAYLSRDGGERGAPFP